MASNPPLPKGALAISDLVAMFEPTLGREKSDEIVRGAASELGMTAPILDKPRVLALIDRLSASQGVAGVAARFVRARYTRLSISSIPPTGAPVEAAAAQPPPSPRAVVTHESLVELLAPSLGKEKSVELVDAAAKRFGIAVARLDRADALRILDALTEAQGIVGVAARFAKARALLAFG